MRRIVVALVVVSMAFGIAGCGGGGDEAAPAETDAAAAAPAAAAPAAVVPTEPDRSPTESGYPAAFPAITSTETPVALQEKLDAGRPMAILFYDGTEAVTDDLRAELDAALAEYRGLIDLLTFNVAGPASSAPSEDAELATLLAEDLGVSATPYVILVDGNGFITWRVKGFVDREIIGREVLRATE